jgi:hypothetical protein
MGLLDNVMKAVGGQLSGKGQGGLMEQVLDLINNPETGGLEIGRASCRERVFVHV